MHPIKIRGARIASAIATSLCLLAAPALGDDRPWEQARWHTLNVHFLSSGENLFSERRKLESPIHTNEKHGFEYSRGLSLNLGKKFIFRIPGPLIAERTPGLAFEIRF